MPRRQHATTTGSDARAASAWNPRTGATGVPIVGTRATRSGAVSKH